MTLMVDGIFSFLFAEFGIRGDAHGLYRLQEAGDDALIVLRLVNVDAFNVREPLLKCCHLN